MQTANTPTITYQRGIALDAADVARVLDASGITRPTSDLARIHQMYTQANLVFSAWDGTRLIGVSRALTDFCYCCYLSDLAVDKAYQRQGIGLALIHLTRQAIGEGASLILLSAPQAMDYYPQVGFEQAGNAFIIKRKQ
jgi:predicted N-acetyltransferase YhbS